jgi:hypothetical protein
MNGARRLTFYAKIAYNFGKQSGSLTTTDTLEIVNLTSRFADDLAVGCGYAAPYRSIQHPNREIIRLLVLSLPSATSPCHEALPKQKNSSDSSCH